jgi:hypothetical protein
MNTSTRHDGPTWFPLFEFQDWLYQSYLLLPQPADADAAAGTPVGAKKWSMGTLLCGQAFTADAGHYALTGTLRFPSGGELAIVANGRLGSAYAPASFEATATGTGVLKGMVSELVGWVVPELPIQRRCAGSVRSRCNPRGSRHRCKARDRPERHAARHSRHVRDRTGELTRTFISNRTGDPTCQRFPSM